MKLLKDIKAEEGSLRAMVLEDADDQISYVRDAAERGCVGGNCTRLVYYSDTHNFYHERAEEIDELLETMREDGRLT